MHFHGHTSWCRVALLRARPHGQLVASTTDELSYGLVSADLTTDLEPLSAKQKCNLADVGSPWAGFQ